MTDNSLISWGTARVFRDTHPVRPATLERTLNERQGRKADEAKEEGPLQVCNLGPGIDQM